MEVNVEEGRPPDENAVTEADDARGDINIPDPEVIVIDDDDDDFVVAGGGNGCNDSTTTTDAVVPPPFKPGDHITYDCNVVGSFLMYQHHAIVLAVGHDSFVESSTKSNIRCDNSTNENDEWTMCITDFTCDDSSGGLSNCGVGSVNSSSPSSSTLFGCYSYVTTKTATTVTDSFLKSFSGGRRNQEDRRDDDNNNGDDAPRNVEYDCNSTNQHQQAQPDSQLRILCVSTKGWKKVEYSSNNLNDYDSIVRHRIKFLLRHPQLIPKYNLLQSNCECVAVWCKTGVWQTLQAKYWLERSRPITNIIGYRRSRTATTGDGDDDSVNLEERRLTKAATTARPPATTNVAGRAAATVGMVSFAGMTYASTTTTAAAAAAIAAAEITSHMLCPQMKWKEQTQLLNDSFLNENTKKRRRTRF